MSSGSIGRSSGPQPWDTYSKTDDDNLKVARVSSTDNAIVRFDGTSGAVQNSSVVIDDSGNVGIGVTPSAWQSGFKAIQLSTMASLNVDGAVSGSGAYFGNNVYRDSTNSRWQYLLGDSATQYVQAGGQHIWRTATSGTAGNAITWTQAMTIDSSGNVGIGTSSPTGKLDLNGKQIYRNGSDSRTGSIYNNGDGTLRIGSEGGSGITEILFQKYGGTEAMRIDSSGNVCIGITGSTAGAKLTNFIGGGTTLTPIANASFVHQQNSGYDHAWTWRTQADGPLRLSFSNQTGWTAFVDMLSISQSGNLQFNSGYGSVATAYGCRAWVNFNGQGTVAIRASGNVSSITDNGTGDFTVNFTNNIVDSNYTVTGCLANDDNSVQFQVKGAGYSNPPTLKTSNSVRVIATTAYGTTTYYDAYTFMVNIHR